jgi:tRNA G26 N,N-dimethylase Trm1
MDIKAKEAKCSWCLTPLLTIFQLVYIVVVLLVEETGVPGENCLENTGQMSHLNVSTFFLHINQLKKFEQVAKIFEMNHFMIFIS